jgi:hypothetical protein
MHEHKNSAGLIWPHLPSTSPSAGSSGRMPSVADAMYGHLRPKPKLPRYYAQMTSAWERVNAKKLLKPL